MKNALHQEKLSTAFNRSKLIQGKMAIPVDLAQAKFGGNFFIEDGKIKAKGADGNPVYSRANPGNLAEFDEALNVVSREMIGFISAVAKDVSAERAALNQQILFP